MYRMVKVWGPLFLVALLYVPPRIGWCSDGQIKIFGVFTCGKFLDDMEKWDRNIMSPAEAEKSWILGYMAGLSVGSGSNLMESLETGDAAIFWMKEYCRKNPLEFVTKGLAQLERELRSRQGQ